jgi:GNAT superfamily N-acetyltransferase
MLEPGTRRALLHVSDAFAEADVFWVLGGHAGLIIQGVDLEDDLELDICTSKSDAEEIAKILRENVVEAMHYMERSHLKALRAVYRIDPARVEVLGDPLIRVGSREWIGLPEENIRRHDFEGRSLRVFTLESEYRLYGAATWKAERNRRIAAKIGDLLGESREIPGHVDMCAGYEIRRARAGEERFLPQVERAAARLYEEWMDVLGLTEKGMENVTTVEEFRQAQEIGHLWIAVSDSNRPVGFALVRELDGDAHLKELNVAPSHGRRGLGSRLLATVCEWAREAGYSAVTLSTFREVPWNGPFYRRHGFRALEFDELTEGLRELIELERRRGLRTDLRAIMRRNVGGT